MVLVYSSVYGNLAITNFFVLLHGLHRPRSTFVSSIKTLEWLLGKPHLFSYDYFCEHVEGLKHVPLLISPGGGATA
jgi:hypothetical protein